MAVCRSDLLGRDVIFQMRPVLSVSSVWCECFGSEDCFSHSVLSREQTYLYYVIESKPQHGKQGFSSLVVCHVSLKNILRSD